MTWSEAPDGLDKLYVALPAHPHVPGETLWAKRLSNGLFELRNVPFHAYGLNFLDIVEATPSDEGTLTVRRRHERGGHHTLRVRFSESTLREERLPMLLKLRPLGATFEGASGAYFAIDVDPHGEYDGVCAQLDRWESEELLAYETCEAVGATTFDVGKEPRRL